MIFLGIYQLGSGIVGAIKRRKGRGSYLLGAIVYLVIGSISMYLLDHYRWASKFELVLIVHLLFVKCEVPQNSNAALHEPKVYTQYVSVLAEFGLTKTLGGRSS